MEIKGVIFDLDGTLIHTIEDIGDAANALLGKYGIEPYTTEDYIRWIGNGAAKLIERAMGDKVSQDQLMAYVREFKEIYGQNLHNKSHVYKGIPQVLNAFQERGVTMTILSNKPHHLTLQVTDHYFSNWPFKAIFGQRDQVPRKPDPASAIELAAIMGISREKILFVGDSPGDIKTAKAAGMIPVGVTWGYGRLENEHDNLGGWIINKPSELIEIISKN